MSAPMKSTHPILYERCPHCGGSGRDHPDSRIHDDAPETPLAGRRRRHVSPCLPCLGRGFTKTPLTSQFVAELVEEHAAALEAAQAFAALCEEGEVSYLSDGALHAVYARLTGVLERARRAGRLGSPG